MLGSFSNDLGESPGSWSVFEIHSLQVKDLGWPGVPAGLELGITGKDSWSYQVDLVGLN